MTISLHHLTKFLDEYTARFLINITFASYKEKQFIMLWCCKGLVVGHCNTEVTLLPFGHQVPCKHLGRLGNWTRSGRVFWGRVSRYWVKRQKCGEQEQVLNIVFTGHSPIVWRPSYTARHFTFELFRYYGNTPERVSGQIAEKTDRQNRNKAKAKLFFCTMCKSRHTVPIGDR